MILERLNRQDEINEHYQQLVQTLETTKMNNVIEKGDVQIVDLAKNLLDHLVQTIREIL